jgi:hypothetical protein|tara:strand:+ start:623 stop:1372 length:750 start_codon:yes stop_codon:yes gene_type:complete
VEKSDWAAVVAQAPRGALSGTVWRIVESQEDIATRDLVDTLPEQALLEELLEESKPNLPKEAARLDYLLSTPFRYPPLFWGSRFGTAHEASLYYGAMHKNTVFAELAFYRFIFRAGMVSDFPHKTLLTNHTLFSAKYALKPGLDLRAAPFVEYADILRHKTNYGPTQNLGTVLRDAEIQGFYFPSARCPENGTNIALFTPDALTSRRPVEQHQCYCETSPEHVIIRQAFDIYIFPRDLFLVAGELPTPA